MIHRTNSFPSRISLFCLALATTVIGLSALETNAQRRPNADVYQKVSFKATKTCSVPASGEVTALVKNGVELSVSEDWDCDGVADAYDNCVGMADRTQTDSNNDGIGDACEAATIVRSGAAVKVRPKANIERREAKAIDRRSRSVAKTRRGRADRAKPREVKVRGRKQTRRRT